jgi:hypothetical protein
MQVLMEDLLFWQYGDDGSDVEGSGVDVVRFFLLTGIVPSIGVRE